MVEKVFAKSVFRRILSCAIVVLAVLCLFAACSNGNTGADNHVHAFSMWEIKTEASCIAQGMQARKCSTCGFEEYSQIPMQGHTLVTDNAVKETCTTDGKTEGSHCSVCKNTIAAQTNIPATGHTSVVDAAITATCTTDGKTEGSHCAVCNTVIVAQTKVAATGHILLTNAAMNATCTTDGKTESKHCTTCQEVILASTTIPATGHTPVVDAAVKATCTTDGKTEGSHCAVCNTVIVAQAKIAATGHSPVVDAAVAATCTTDGKTEGSHCAVCNEVIVAQAKIAATGHSPVVDAAVKATCTTDGKTEGSHCAVCNAVIVVQTKIAATGHDWKAATYTTPKTCKTCGSTEGSPLEFTAEEIYEKVSPSVVEITAQSASIISTGTGFFIDKNGTVVTNYHVIEKCTSATITLKDGRTFTVTKVLGYSESRDIAILSTNCNNSIPLELRKTAVKTGEKVYAIGSSLGLSGTLSEGIISTAEREIGGQIYIQTTAPISPGNSGGPLLDKTGMVVGINTATLENGQNLNFAIPISEIDTISRSNPTTLPEMFRQNVEWISQRDFFYYDDDEAYVLLFQLADEDKIPMSSSGKVDIRIVNNDGITVYSKTHIFTEKDFYYWTDGSNDSYDLYLATIYIDPADIAIGSCADGKVCFVVYGDDYYFNESTLSTNELPVSAIVVLKNHVLAHGTYDSQNKWYEVYKTYNYSTYRVNMSLTYEPNPEGETISATMSYYGTDNTCFLVYLSLINRGNGLYYAGSYRVKNGSSNYEELNYTNGFIDPNNFTDQTVLTYMIYDGLPDQKTALLNIYASGIQDLLDWLSMYLENESVGITITDLGFTAYN